VGHIAPHTQTSHISPHLTTPHATTSHTFTPRALHLRRYPEGQSYFVRPAATMMTTTYSHRGVTAHQARGRTTD